MVNSYFGVMRARMQSRHDVAEMLSCRPELRLRIYPEALLFAKVRTSHGIEQAGSVIDVNNMHACNHTKNFISDMSHFWMDAKYLIMANTQAPVEIWYCDGQAAVFAPN